MKFNKLFLLAVGALGLIACEDDLSTIGSSVRPSGDDLSIKSEVFELQSRTFKADGIYVKTSTPMLGEIKDPFYGSIRADYMAQVYCPPNFNLDVKNSSDSLLFEYGFDEIQNNQLDSAVLYVYYSSYIGDSLAPMQVTAYQADKNIPKDFYSNQDFDEYISSKKVLGIKGYTGKDMSVSDSIRSEDNYIPTIGIKLTDEFKNDIFGKMISEAPELKDSDAFNEYFKGVYLKNTYGRGTMLEIIGTEIAFHYTTIHKYEPDRVTLLKDKDGKDSTFTASRVKYMAVTPDVIQLNSVEHKISDDRHNDLMNSDTASYIISPAGYFTEIDIPVGRILNQLKSDPAFSKQFLNGVKLDVQAYKPTSDIFYAAPPTNMLLVEKDLMNEFFEDNKIPDQKTTFYATYASDSTNNVYNYNFGNINKLVMSKQSELKEKYGDDIPDDEVIKMAMVPVTLTLDSYYNSYITKTSNYFTPGGVVLKAGEKQPQKVTMTYTLQ